MELKNKSCQFYQLDACDEKKIIGGIVFSSIIAGIFALIFGIPMIEKMLNSDEGKVKLPLGISGEWENHKAVVDKEIIHSQTVSPTFYN